MKQYLIACDLGGMVIGTYTVQTPDQYVPTMDDMDFLKKEIVRNEKPKKHRTWANSRPGCSGDLNTASCEEIRPEDLKIIALSRLDL